ncbi:MAG: hypothetical protein HYR88_15450 [Verrucomicrobia bacterium]|nr:hypothetical protein [Verrucomicrobiota bacterium]
MIQERNSSNTPLVTYVRGLDLSGTFERAGGIGGLLSRTAHTGANGATLTHAFYHADANGNVTKLVDASQASVADYKYDPFGRTISSSGSLASANTYRFSSKDLMTVSGFYYYGYRFYDPVTQRWLNRDPIQERGGQNLYGCVKNNPVGLVDPLGLHGAGGSYVEVEPWDREVMFPGQYRGPLRVWDPRDLSDIDAEGNHLEWREWPEYGEPTSSCKDINCQGVCPLHWTPEPAPPTPPTYPGYYRCGTSLNGGPVNCAPEDKIPPPPLNVTWVPLTTKRSPPPGL